MPRISYTTDSEILVINLIGGAGYFMTPALALGGDTRLDNLDAFGDGEFIVGLRFGMSVYL